MSSKLTVLLRSLARFYGVQTAYYDSHGHVRYPSHDALIAVLRALGAPVEHMDDVRLALHERERNIWRRSIEPVSVAWGRGPLKIRLRVPLDLAGSSIHYEILLENKDRLTGTSNWNKVERLTRKEVDGVVYLRGWLTLTDKLPFGYHHLRLIIGGSSFESLIISAPWHASSIPNMRRRAWGVFLPLYALQSRESWGAGDLTDLAGLAEWIRKLGCEVVATLPLLSAFLEQPYEPSPYAPVSRLFWNEFYVDVTRVPEYMDCAATRSLVSSPDFQSRIGALRSSSLVNYDQGMFLKRKALEELLRHLLHESSERFTAFYRFVNSRPQVEDYAEFRAAVETQRKPWREWTDSARGGVLNPGDYREEVKQYHLYAQWVVHEQMEALVEKMGRLETALYLDLPLGVHRDGYDVWRESIFFAEDVNVGAPPDAFFSKGQNWGFPPFHPERLREQGYRYFIACLQNHLKYSRLLRIDHIMGLHRLFLIPEGAEPADGVYVHYRPEEFYAILNLESHKHGSVIVGENLGTVPPYVNDSMAEHKIWGMYVGQFSIMPQAEEVLGEVSPDTVASLNTHDTPTFASFWEGLDIDDRLDLGLLDDNGVVEKRAERRSQREALVHFLKTRGWMKEEIPSAEVVLKAWLGYLSCQPAKLLLINLEDLWLEIRPQNTPGTWRERPNWCRKARYTFEQIAQMDQILDILSRISNCRKKQGEKQTE
jgi:4-alpha-glucanotransferase